MIKEKVPFCIGQNNCRIKSNFVAFEKTCATAYEQNV